VDQPDKYTYDFLALRILMQRVARATKTATAAEKSKLVDELVAFFTKNARLLSTDIKTLFG
jgi:hypothetical protein